MIKNSIALVIGISSYQNKSLSLPQNIIADARNISSVLVNPEYCAFSSEKVQLLLNEDASLQAMRDAFATLIAHCNRQSTVIIYFSGHGGQVERGEDGYLLPTDVGEDFAETAFSSAELSQVLKDIPARKVLVVIDSCHAGGIGQLKGVAQHNAFKAGLPDKNYDELSSGRGKVIFASSRGSESSLVLPGETNSLFTKHFLAGLKGGAASSDGYTRVFDLYHYLQPKVQQDSHYTQNPFFKSYIEDNFPLAFNSHRVTSVDSQQSEEKRYDFDVFISYLDKDRDVDWVMDELQPMLETSGLKVVDAHSRVMKGAVRISNMATGFKVARKIILVMSDAYLADNESNFENVMFQDMGIKEGSWRVIPVYWEEVDKSLIPDRLSMLAGANLKHSNARRRVQEMQSLLDYLKS